MHPTSLPHLLLDHFHHFQLGQLALEFLLLQLPVVPACHSGQTLSVEPYCSVLKLEMQVHACRWQSALLISVAFLDIEIPT